MREIECDIVVRVRVDCYDEHDVDDALEDWLGDNSAVTILRWERTS